MPALDFIKTSTTAGSVPAQPAARALAATSFAARCAANKAGPSRRVATALHPKDRHLSKPACPHNSSFVNATPTFDPSRQTMRQVLRGLPSFVSSRTKRGGNSSLLPSITRRAPISETSDIVHSRGVCPGSVNMLAPYRNWRRGFLRDSLREPVFAVFAIAALSPRARPVRRGPMRAWGRVNRGA